MEVRIQGLSDHLSTYGLQILMAIAIFVIGRWVIGKMANLFRQVLQKRNVDPALSGFLSHFVYYGGMTFVVLAVLSRLGIQTASFIAVLGAAGLAVGMALQGSLANFAAGVMIILFRPFKIDQFVKAGGEKGTVKEIGIFTTTLSSPDNVRVIVPNSQMLSGSILNYSANDTRRVDLVFGISYSDDIARAKEVFNRVLAAESRILQDPAPTIAVSELADSSVNFVVRPWVRSADYWGVYFNLTEKTKIALEDAGLSIPFPQRDVHLQNASAAVGEAKTPSTVN